jgi:hypothetical protein
LVYFASMTVPLLWEEVEPIWKDITYGGGDIRSADDGEQF